MNAMRRRALLTGLFLISGVGPLMMSGTAQAETWCRRDFDRDNPVCVFSSARDCVRAAAIMGGSCERERLVHREERVVGGGEDLDGRTNVGDARQR